LAAGAGWLLARQRARFRLLRKYARGLDRVVQRD
jgi:hypothetical protein